MVLKDTTGGVVTGADAQFIQNEDLTRAGVAVHPYGAFIVPKKTPAICIQPEAEIIKLDTKYLLASGLTASQISVGMDITLAKET